MLINLLVGQDWACEVKGWNICRIDGSTTPLERKERMNQFQNGGDSPDAPILFLLSTRAGGLGINLVAADTVIFYDQDWVRFVCTLGLFVRPTYGILEPTNGCSSARQSPPNWTDETGVNFQARNCSYDRDENYATRNGEAET
jgi:hypothetical protein